MNNKVDEFLKVALPALAGGLASYQGHLGSYQQGYLGVQQEKRRMQREQAQEDFARQREARLVHAEEIRAAKEAEMLDAAKMKHTHDLLGSVLEPFKKNPLYSKDGIPKEFADQTAVMVPGLGRVTLSQAIEAYGGVISPEGNYRLGEYVEPPTPRLTNQYNPTTKQTTRVPDVEGLDVTPAPPKPSLIQGAGGVMIENKPGAKFYQPPRTPAEEPLYEIPDPNDPTKSIRVPRSQARGKPAFRPTPKSSTTETFYANALKELGLGDTGTTAPTTKPAPQKAPAPIGVLAPNGKTYTFSSQADADNFRRAAGIK